MGSSHAISEKEDVMEPLGLVEVPVKEGCYFISGAYIKTTSALQHSQHERVDAIGETRSR